MEERMDKGILQQERVKSLNKEQDNGRSSDDEKLKASVASLKNSDETGLNDFVTCNYIRGYN